MVFLIHTGYLVLWTGLESGNLRIQCWPTDCTVQWVWASFGFDKCKFRAAGQRTKQTNKQTTHPTLDTTRPPALQGSSPAKNVSVQFRAPYLQTGRTSAGRWTWQRASSRLARYRLWGGKTTRWSGSRRTRAPSFASVTCRSWGPSSDTQRRGTEENSEWQIRYGGEDYMIWSFSSRVLHWKLLGRLDGRAM